MMSQVIEKISEGCEELHIIDISLCTTVTDTGFSQFSKCKNLRGILAAKCRNITDEGK